MHFILDSNNNVVKNIEMLLSQPNHYYGDVIVCCEERSFNIVSGLKMIIYTDDHPPEHFHLISEADNLHYKVYLDKDLSISSWERQLKSKVIKRNAQRTVTDWFNSDGYVLFVETWNKSIEAL